jgi:hypothetical protein
VETPDGTVKAKKHPGRQKTGSVSVIEIPQLQLQFAVVYNGNSFGVGCIYVLFSHGMYAQELSNQDQARPCYRTFQADCVQMLSNTISGFGPFMGFPTHLPATVLKQKASR